VKLGRKSVPFETQKPFLTTKAKIQSQEVRLPVDSGTSELLVYRKRLQARLEPLAANRDASIFTAAGVMRTAWVRTSQSRQAMRTWGPQIMLIADGEPDPSYQFDRLLGFTKIGFRRVWLDFINGLLGWD
jgi:hypothetical protein